MLQQAQKAKHLHEQYAVRNWHRRQGIAGPEGQAPARTISRKKLAPASGNSRPRRPSTCTNNKQEETGTGVRV